MTKIDYLDFIDKNKQPALIDYLTFQADCLENVISQSKKLNLNYSKEIDLLLCLKCLTYHFEQKND